MDIGDKKGMLTLISKPYTLLRVNGKKTDKVGDFRCICGKIVIIPISGGHRKSCGCYKEHKMSFGESSFNQLYRDYKHNAQKRQYDFSLSKDQFREITKKECFYCGSEPLQFKKGKRSFGHYIYNGVDRVDNSIGYFVHNCVPCCGTCNMCKGTMSHNDFISLIRKISNRLTSN